MAIASGLNPDSARTMAVNVTGATAGAQASARARKGGTSLPGG